MDDPHFFGWRTKRSSTVHSPISIMFLIVLILHPQIYSDGSDKD